jgi:hypothetical protein
VQGIYEYRRPEVLSETVKIQTWHTAAAVVVVVVVVVIVAVVIVAAVV